MSCFKIRRDQKQNAFFRLLFFLGFAAIFIFGNLNNLDAAETKKINKIEFETISGTDSIVISSDKKLIFSDVKKLSPLGVVIYFPGTEIIQTGTIDTDSSDVIKSISTSYFSDNKTTRVEILLNKDIYYKISSTGSLLRVSFENPSATTATTEPAKKEETETSVDDIAKDDSSTEVSTAKKDTSATVAEGQKESDKKTSDVEKVSEDKDSIQVEKIDVVENLDETVIHIKTSAEVDDFNSFVINEPPRIVLDIFNVKSSYKGEQRIDVNSSHARYVRHYSYPERLRLVIDTKKEFLSSYVTNSISDGIQIIIKGSAVASETKDVAEKSVSQKTEAKEVVAKSKKPSKKVKPAVINVIEFTTEDNGESLVTIETSQPVSYKLNKTSTKKLNLHLYNTFIPDFRKRQLITTRFDSAVDRITPVQTTQMGNNALFVIELRDDVEFSSAQDVNTITIKIASTNVPPKPANQANLPQWQQVLKEEMIFDEEDSGEISSLTTTGSGNKTGAGAKQAKKQILGKPINTVLDVTDDRVFYGEKIAIDFYETDIKNVFRIIQSISGKNFAIDKDVSGKVTLNIEKPAPWDQILDLVLKMNGLGMIYEGDIIRIATRATVKKEDDFEKSVLLQKRKNLEDAKALEPLITEYIPISYASASDVKAQIDSLLTQGRGTSSTDVRTNQLIVTDTKNTIDRILVTVKQIDKITPQVMIEARIVEANKNFTRELGVNWNLSQNKNLGFQNGNVNLDTMMNFPAGQKLIDFTFSKVPGDFLLDAELYAMESNGDGKIISSPRVLTIDNTEANIKQGFELPYNKLDESGNTSTEFKEVVLELSVTPHVTPDKRVALKVKITKNGVFQMTDAGPSISTKETSTELLVNNSSTVVIGGITQEDVHYDVNGVPLLKDIPGLGYLFKNTTKTQTMTELLIFITPNIITLDEVD